MTKNEKPKKTKYLLKAHIKLHPIIQEPIDNFTKIFTIVVITIIIIGLILITTDTLFIHHPESPYPTQKEIDKICENKSMESYGYTIENNQQKILNKNQTSKTYIICKTPYDVQKKEMR